MPRGLSLTGGCMGIHAGWGHPGKDYRKRVFRNYLAYKLDLKFLRMNSFHKTELMVKKAK